jgi:anaerobic sulfite reductase subunit B
MAYEGSVNPGQFFEVSVPKFGEAPISVCGCGDGYVELTIRRVGKVTNEIFEHYEGDSLFMRGPYGNGFDLDDYRGKELAVSSRRHRGFAPVRGVIDYFASNPEEVKSLKAIAGFKSPADILFFEDIARWKKTSEVISDR